MNNIDIQKEVAKREWLNRFNIEKSIEGTEAYNMNQDIMKGASEEEILEKARSGIYSNTLENRKKGRVGQKYGSEKKEDEETQVNYFTDKFIRKMNDSIPSEAAWWIDSISEISSKEKQKIWTNIQNNLDKKSRDRQFEHGDVPSWFKKSQQDDIQKAEQSKAQQAKIAKVMEEFKNGTLKSSSGEKVIDRKQALAIGMSEAGMTQKSEYNDLIKAIESSEEYIYSIDDIKITKTGKEIKEALVKKLTEMETEKLPYLTQLSTISKQVGEVPDIDFCQDESYMCRGFEKDLAGLPKKYKIDYSENSTIYQGDQQVNLKDLKRQYNSLLYDYVRLCKDKLKVDTVVRNIDEKKKCNLKANLAATLGF